MGRSWFMFPAWLARLKVVRGRSEASKAYESIDRRIAKHHTSRTSKEWFIIDEYRCPKNRTQKKRTLLLYLFDSDP